MPGTAAGAEVRKDGDHWTLVLVREMRHPPTTVWHALTEWQLEPLGEGTRLTLWHGIDRRFIAWGAAGWHVCFDVLARLLAGEPMGRLVGAEVLTFGGWQRLVAEYAKQLGVETPGWPPGAAKP